MKILGLLLFLTMSSLSIFSMEQEGFEPDKKKLKVGSFVVTCLLKNCSNPQCAQIKNNDSSSSRSSSLENFEQNDVVSSSSSIEDFIQGQSENYVLLSTNDSQVSPLLKNMVVKRNFDEIE